MSEVRDEGRKAVEAVRQAVAAKAGLSDLEVCEPLVPREMRAVCCVGVTKVKWGPLCCVCFPATIIFSVLHTQRVHQGYL